MRFNLIKFRLLLLSKTYKTEIAKTLYKNFRILQENELLYQRTNLFSLFVNYNNKFTARVFIQILLLGYLTSARMASAGYLKNPKHALYLTDNKHNFISFLVLLKLTFSHKNRQ